MNCHLSLVDKKQKQTHRLAGIEVQLRVVHWMERIRERVHVRPVATGFTRRRGRLHGADVHRAAAEAVRLLQTQRNGFVIK